MQLATKCVKNMLIVSLVSGLVACGGGGGGGGDGRYTPTLPADAVRITAANATDIANSVFGSIEGLLLITSRGGEAPPSLAEILQLATARVQQRSRRPSGIAERPETQDCDPSSPQGSITVSGNESSGSATGSAVFSNCVLGGVTFEGRVTFNSTFDDVSGAYSDDFNGSLSLSFGTESFTMVFDLVESGNFLSGNYTSNMAFSVSGIPGGGFLVTTTQSLTGDTFNIFTGQVLVQGADNTRLRITITNNTADVDLDEGSGFVDFATCFNLSCN